jgi:hypothetical protein
MNYDVPNELEFFERGFGLSGENDPDEGLFSYMQSYGNGKQLIFTHSPCSGNSISIKFIEGNETVVYLYQEGVSSIAFQAWNESKIIRVYFEANVDKELRISYFPRPNFHFAELK